MRNNSLLIFNIFLVIGDFLALVFAFSVAYILRVTLDHRALSVAIHARTYLIIFLTLLPFWILIFALLNLYSSQFLEKRFSEIGRLLIGSFIGTLFVISYSYITNIQIFPARIVTLYGFFLAFFFVLLFRTLARIIRKELFKVNFGINNVVIIGKNKTTKLLITLLSDTPLTGYNIIGIIGPVISDIALNHFKYFDDFGSFINSKTATQVHTIIQTELFASSQKNDEILTFAQENHIAYRFVPGNNELFTGNMTVDLFHSIPIIAVHQTPLIGWGKVVKRLFDIAVASLLFLIFSPIMLIILIILMFNHGDPIFSQTRLSRFGSKIKIYKFRTILKEYNRMSPEDGFNKMNRPELAKIYRSNGDFLENDPRISKLGKFLRKTSLDELPQLLNVIKGDLSLVGPRPLEPFELDKYGKKNLILSVKSGITGLAIISGRRDIPFEERRKLDLYYVQNWNFWTDLVILFKTVIIIIGHRGAK